MQNAASQTHPPRRNHVGSCTQLLRDQRGANLVEYIILVGVVEINQGWGRRVLVQPNLVEALEAFRTSVGKAVSLNSGYRSPRHQEAICKSICGNPLGCNGTCSNNSSHMFGDAADLPSAYYATAK